MLPAATDRHGVGSASRLDGGMLPRPPEGDLHVRMPGNVCLSLPFSAPPASCLARGFDGGGAPDCMLRLPERQGVSFASAASQQIYALWNRPEGSLPLFGNDPSAGSPTDTLLRLLLPLLQIIYTSSRHAASRPEPAYGTNPRRSLTGAIGSSDGRCVQRAGTQSTRADDSRLLGIPRSWEIIASPNP